MTVVSKPTKRGASGFTLIELLVVIAIIAVLIGLILPPLQRVRLDVDQRAASSDLAEILSAASRYQAQYRVYPSELAALTAFGLGRELASGVDDGYLFSIVTATPFTFQVQAAPAAPGKTGLNTCTIDQDGTIQCAPTDRAVIVERMMFWRVAALAASTVSNLVLRRDAPATTESEIKAHLARPSTVDEVFDGFDTSHDGIVTFSKIFQRRGDPEGDGLGAELSQFLLAVQNELALGVGNEHVFSLPGISRSDLPLHYCSQGAEGDANHCRIFADPELRRH